ncbi:MAG: ABC transporter permease subunit [Clostridiales bacterium]|nr:ABC transporter permease subunit [Clostridiales bacterium]
MLAILKRDLRGYFTSPIGYVFIAAFLAVLNSYFYINNILQATSDIASLFGFIRFVLIFTVPILTMRLFSEEYKQKTDQLLLTSPNGVFGIVLGKFLAALAMFSVVILFSLLYLVIIAAYGQPNVRQVLANYIAIYCVAAAFISMGLLLSSLTENQLISAVLALAVFLGLYLLDYSGIGQNNRIINNFLYAISMFRRYENISRGVLAINDLVYYISVAAIFLFLTTRVIEKKRWS